jgi:hypothetical protein
MLQVQMNYLLGDGALARCAARGTAFMHKRLSPPMVLNCAPTLLQAQ